MPGGILLRDARTAYSERQDTSANLTDTELLVGSMNGVAVIRTSGDATKRLGKFRDTCAPYHWQLIHELGAEGWRANN